MVIFWKLKMDTATSVEIISLSERGAETAAILFSLVETCKLNGVNPREYFKKLVQDIHNKKSPYTPSEFKDLPI